MYGTGYGLGTIIIGKKLSIILEYFTFKLIYFHLPGIGLATGNGLSTGYGANTCLTTGTITCCLKQKLNEKISKQDYYFLKDNIYLWHKFSYR